jgi:membrane-bound serine protease (ClpP class)
MILFRILIVLGLFSLVAGAVRAQEEQPTVVVLPTSGVVDQIVSNYLREGIDRAAAQGAPAVVIQLDTPGGSLEATREIVQAELTAPVPVMVWVGPAGSRAASAGTFLTLAAHVAAMAPATNIGAATPISGDGQDIPDDLGKKVLNDTIATITSISEERGRPVDWAVSEVDSGFGASFFRTFSVLDTANRMEAEADRETGRQAARSWAGLTDDV